MNYLIGDIGNTNIKICKINKKFKIIKTYLFETKNPSLEKNLNKKLKNILKNNTNKKVLFSSVVPNVYKKISKIFNRKKFTVFEIKKFNLKKVMKFKIKKYSQLETLNVSRETFPALEEFRSLLLSENKKINLISKSTEKESIKRHIIDSAQIIDIIDNNTKSCIDLGSGPGLPGIVLAIIFNEKGSKIKFYLYEKSQKKSNFLRKMIRHFKLNADVKQKNIFQEKDLEADIIVARAFKPLQTILELIEKNFVHYNRLILFLGRSGKSMINECLNLWMFDYEIIESLTDVNSVIVKISNLKKL